MLRPFGNKSTENGHKLSLLGLKLIYKPKNGRNLQGMGQSQNFWHRGQEIYENRWKMLSLRTYCILQLIILCTLEHVPHRNAVPCNTESQSHKNMCSGIHCKQNTLKIIWRCTHRASSYNIYMNQQD
jgi:hypothetical protein